MQYKSTLGVKPSHTHTTLLPPLHLLRAQPTSHASAWQACGVPFEPVYIDAATGAWSAPGFNYLEKRADWQKWLDEKHKKRDYMGLDGSSNSIAAAAAAGQQPQDAVQPGLTEQPQRPQQEQKLQEQQ
jgi:hypothetical protein